MLKALRNIEKGDWILYLLFFMTTLGRHVEPFAIILWMLVRGQTGNALRSVTRLLPLFIYIVVVSLIGFAITQFPMDMFVEQTAQLVVYMSIYYAMMMYYKGRYEHVFEIYCNVAFWLALGGIAQYVAGRFMGMQMFSFLQNREVMIGDIMRAQAWMGEASYFAMYLVPAIAYKSLKDGIERPKNLIMIGAGLLSFSPIFKLVLAVFLVYYFIFVKYSIKKMLLYGVAFLAINYINDNYTVSEYDADQTKTNETFEYWGANFSDLETANLSTYALLKNLKISTMADNRITGTGIGSHGYSHDKYYQSSFLYSFLNKNDGFSLGVRLFSEFGIVGLSLFIMFFVKGFNRNNYINISVIFYILYAFLRGGHYTIFGLQFFIMIFYFTSKYKINNYGIDDSYPRS